MPTSERPSARDHIGAGELLRQARRRRGLTQRALATAAGVSQTAVARIEAGKSQPTLPTLTKLLAGAGYEPSVELVNTLRPGELLRLHTSAIRDLLRRYRVTSVQVFGSVARGTDTPRSDLDLLVTFDADVNGLDRVDFAEDLEQLLGVTVDMVNPATASPKFMDSIRDETRPLEDLIDV